MCEKSHGETSAGMWMHFLCILFLQVQSANAPKLPIVSVVDIAITWGGIGFVSLHLWHMLNSHTHTHAKEILKFKFM